MNSISITDNIYALPYQMTQNNKTNNNICFIFSIIYPADKREASG